MKALGVKATRRTTQDKIAESIARKVVALLAARGWKPTKVCEGKGEEYRVVYEEVPTKFGLLEYVSVGVSPHGSRYVGVHVRTRFQDVAAVTGRLSSAFSCNPSLNPYSGKWNFEFYDDPEDKILDLVEDQLDVVDAP